MKKILQDHPADRELEEMLDMAADSVRRIQMMVAEIYEKVRAIKLNPAKQNLLPVVEQGLLEFEKTAGNITVERSFSPVPDVYFDTEHLKKVIRNILDNASEAMNGSGKINVSLKETNNEVVLKIEDTGKGIPIEFLSLIFEPFYSTKNWRKNLGLGLYYCKNVMMQHKGSIRVESAPGQGTSIYLHLKKEQPQPVRSQDRSL